MTDKNNVNNTMRYAGLATQWLVMLAAAVYIGWKIDKWIGPRIGHCAAFSFPLCLFVADHQ